MSRDDHINNNDPGQERVKRPDYWRWRRVTS